MMKTNIRKTAFVAAALTIQCVAFGWLIWRYEDVVRNGTEVRFKCAAYDPSDPFRGRYLRVSVSEECENLLERSDGREWEVYSTHNKGLFAKLEPSTNGLWCVAAVADSPQDEDGLWIKPRNVYVEHAVQWLDKLDNESYEDFTKRREASPLVAMVSMPDQLFMNERLAPVAEEVLRKAVAPDGKGATAVYRVKGGEIVITDIEIDGKSVYCFSIKKEV